MSKISPLEIVKRTKKNNCGQCGHPTCLSFGVAVINSLISPSACPFIDLKGLELAPGNDNSIKNQEQRDLDLIEHLKGKIADLKFSEIAQQLGASFDPSKPDQLILRYLGQEVSLSKDRVLINGIQPDDHRDQILLYNYVFFMGDQSPSNDWIGMESMPNSISKIKTLATYCEDKLARIFAQRPERAMEILSKLDGTEAADHSAAFAAIIPVLPMVPQFILYWGEEPEDNFDAKVKVLYDSKVLNFLDLESLVFSSERLADRIEVLWDK